MAASTDAGRAAASVQLTLGGFGVHDDASALIVGFGANPLLEEAPPS